MHSYRLQINWKFKKNLYVHPVPLLGNPLLSRVTGISCHDENDNAFMYEWAVKDKGDS
jgi:hypothetical protein